MRISITVNVQSDWYQLISINLASIVSLGPPIPSIYSHQRVTTLLLRVMFTNFRHDNSKTSFFQALHHTDVLLSKLQSKIQTVRSSR